MAEKQKSNLNYIILGSGLIIVGVAGIYYIYSKKSVIDEYIKLVKDYEREWKQYIADGDIDIDEGNMLQRKINALNTLEHYIKSRGWGVDLLDALARLGIIVTITLITYRVIKYISKRYPPGGRPPQYTCPFDGRTFDTEDEFKRHLEDEHNIVDTEPAADVWDDIRNLPDWIHGLIAITTGLGNTFYEYIVKPFNELPLGVKLMLIVLILAAIIIIIALLNGLLLPFMGALETIMAGLTACFA